MHALAGAVSEAWAVPMVGASAGTMGLLAACCVMEPDGVMVLYFIPIRARYALILAVGLSAFLTLVPRFGGGIAHTAHLGGLLAGLALIRYGLPSSSWMDALGDWWRIRARGTGSGRKTNSSANVRAQASESQAGGDFISREVDPILEKISAQGIHSLTAEERRILEAAQKRMNR